MATIPFILVAVDRDDRTHLQGDQRRTVGSLTKFRSGAGGLFARWDWDEIQRSLTAQTDPFGIYSLFYARVGNGVAVSPSLFQILALGAPTALDDEALSVFYLLGWFMGEDTPFKHVKVLPPDGKLFWSPGKDLSITQGRSKIVTKQPISKKVAIERFAELFSASISSCWEGRENVAIALSGGRDSRHTFLESIRQGHKFTHCATVNPMPGTFADGDLVSASQLAAENTVEHVEIDGYTTKKADQVLSVPYSQLCSDEHYRFLAIARHFAGRKSTILDGIAGDALSRNKSFTHVGRTQMILSGKLREAAEDMARDMDRITSTRLETRLGEPSFEFSRTKAIDRISHELSLFESTSDPFSHFIFWTRTRREIGYVTIILMMGASDVLCPYLDPELVEFCLSLPFEVTSSGEFHDDVITHSFPGCAVAYHDKIKRPHPRSSVHTKVGQILRAIFATRFLGPATLLNESFTQSWMALNGTNEIYTTWRTYRNLLNQCTSEENVQSIIDVIPPLH